MSTRNGFRRRFLKAKGRFSAAMRRRRMRHFLSVMQIRGGERIIDLGGQSGFWADVALPLDITIVNLPGTLGNAPAQTPHRFTMVEGDACGLDYPDGSFDLAFSNSVIEHVGGPDRQMAMAREARRLASRYWVQTPSIWFPMEAHTNMPFWWFYPAPLKRRLILRWRRILPAWCEMVEGTTVISHREMQKMFPDAQMWTERLAGIPKSYVAYNLGRTRQG
jgi:hypothetical protein